MQVAVVMEPSMADPSKWPGAVGMELGSQLYYSLQSDVEAEFNKGVQMIIEAILSKLRRMMPGVTLSSPKPAAAASTSPKVEVEELTTPEFEATKLALAEDKRKQEEAEKRQREEEAEAKKQLEAEKLAIEFAKMQLEAEKEKLRLQVEKDKLEAEKLLMEAERAKLSKSQSAPQPDDGLSEVARWLAGITGLAGYAECIMEQGYEELSDLLDADEEDLQEVCTEAKMKKPHAKKFLKAVVALGVGGPPIVGTTSTPPPAKEPECEAPVAKESLTGGGAEQPGVNLSKQHSVACFVKSEGSSAAAARMACDDLEETKILASTRWADLDPGHGVFDELSTNSGIRERVGSIEALVGDCRLKASELKFEPDLPHGLSEDHLGALVAYTHDKQTGKREGNLYFELNKMLRARGLQQRAAMMRVWGGFMFHIMAALAVLPDFEGFVYRGYPDKEEVKTEYKKGKTIQWRVRRPPAGAAAPPPRRFPPSTADKPFQSRGSSAFLN